MLNELAKEIHELAVSKGWWEQERSFAEIIALCHSELSEALEEYRNGKSIIYHDCEYHDTRWKCPDKFDGCQYGENKGCMISKLEGIAVELADTIIRILDYCGKENIDIDSIIAYGDIGNPPDDFSLPKLIAHSHWKLSMAYESYISYRNDYQDWLVSCIYIIQEWCKLKKVDLDEIIRIKHEYNKTRPYKHGGKII